MQRETSSDARMPVCLLPYAAPLSGGGTWTGDPSNGYATAERRHSVSACGMEVAQRPPDTSSLPASAVSPVSTRPTYPDTSNSSNQWGAVQHAGVVPVNPAPTSFASAPYNSVAPPSHLGVYPPTAGVRYFPVNTAPCAGPAPRPARSVPNTLPLNSPVSASACELSHVSPYHRSTSSMSSNPATPVPVSPLCRPTQGMPVAGTFVPTMSPTGIASRPPPQPPIKEKKAVRPYKLPVGAARKAAAASTPE